MERQALPPGSVRGEDGARCAPPAIMSPVRILAVVVILSSLDVWKHVCFSLIFRFLLLSLQNRYSVSPRYLEIHQKASVNEFVNKTIAKQKLTFGAKGSYWLTISRAGTCLLFERQYCQQVSLQKNKAHVYINIYLSNIWLLQLILSGTHFNYWFWDRQISQRSIKCGGTLLIFFEETTL